MEKLVYELFAGVGGFHLGLSNANLGWEIVAANQWEPSRKSQHAYECYIKNFPNVVTYNKDIAIVTANPEQFPIPNYNLLVGGFPCQDYSVAATGARGIEGIKGVLWWEIRKILEARRPPFVLLENVDRLLKSPAKQRGRDFGVMLACFRDLGYSVEWRVINAAEYGFPQRRRRIFIFAFHNSTLYHQRQTQELDIFESDDYIRNRGFFAEEFPIEEILERNQITFNEDVLTISDNGRFDFYNSGVMIGDKIVSEKYVPIHLEPIVLHDILEENVDDRFYLGQDLERWEYMKGAKAEPRRTRDGFEYMFREGAKIGRAHV